jgi:hypothetical protein
VLHIHFLAWLLFLFYFSAYKFYKRDYCKSYAENEHYTENDFTSVQLLLLELFKCLITEYSLHRHYVKITIRSNAWIQRNPQWYRDQTKDFLWNLYPSLLLSALTVSWVVNIVFHDKCVTYCQVLCSFFKFTMYTISSEQNMCTEWIALIQRSKIIHIIHDSHFLFQYLKRKTNKNFIKNLAPESSSR